MLDGLLKTGKDGKVCILSALNGEGRSIIKPGQYLYINVARGWIPVELKYSDREKQFYFEHLPNLPVNGRMALVK